jgi:hypothetical protein
MFVKNLITGCVLLVLIGSAAWSDPVRPGFVEGHVKIFPLSDVNLADDGNRTNTATAERYAEYPLVVLARDGKKEVAQVTVNRDGNYRIELPPGDYILDAQGPESRPVRAKPRPFTIVSNQTVRVNMDIDTGIR